MSVRTGSRQQLSPPTPADSLGRCSLGRLPAAGTRRWGTAPRRSLLTSAAVALAALLPTLGNARGDEVPSYRYPLLDAELSQWVVTGCEVEVIPESSSAGPRLRLISGHGLVRSAHRLADFELQFEWRPVKREGWNSGLFFRAEAPEGDAPWPATYQIDLRQGEAGRLLGVPVTVPDGLIQEDDWNQFHLRVVGSRAELTINGQPAWSTDEIQARDGYLGLQAEVPEGGPFEFRNMQLTEIGFRSLFNGHDLSGWEGATQDASSCWKVEDQWLICTGEKGTWLRSEEQFGDFNLRFAYRLKTGGNSGIYVRVPEDGNHHGDGAGVEIQLLDDHADRYRDLKPYQYCGSVYAIVPAEPRVGRPAGQWNVMEIDCRGTSYRVVHNGIEIIHADAKDHPELAGRLVHGYLGLQNHSEEVWFQHLRIGPSRQDP